MANTFTKIASVTVPTGGQASMTFTSIPSTYTDLVVKISSRGINANTYDYISIAFNGSTASQSQIQIEGDGTSATSYSASNFQFITDGASNTASTFGNHELYVPNYLTANYKAASFDSVMEQNGTTAYSDFKVYLWSNIAAITSITLTGVTGNFAEFSTATLYGISNT
jgi:hypothetical protein